MVGTALSHKLDKPGPGRPKGAVNKIGKAAKEVIALAAEELGGIERLVAWAKEDPKNEHAFWATIYPKLLPLQVYGAVEIGLSREASEWLGLKS